MSETQTESTNLAVVEETTFNAFTPPASVWRNLQPNSYGNFGSTYKKTPRDPISKNLQLRKGMLTDQDSMVPFEHDITKDLIDRFGEAIFRCSTKHSGGTGQSLFQVTGITSTGYTVADDGDLQQRTLVYVRGAKNEANNGLKLVGAASTTTEVKVSGLTVEAIAADENVTLEVAGFRFASGDLVMTNDGNLTCTTADLTTMGLNEEQWVVIGGREDDATFSFDNPNYRHAARIEAIAAGQLTLSRRTWTVVPNFTFTANAGDDVCTATDHGMTASDDVFGPVTVSNSGGALPTGLSAATPYFLAILDEDTFKFATSRANAVAGTFIDITGAGTGTHTVLTSDPGTGQEVEVYFSRWYRNVPVDHDDFKKPSFAFEVTYNELDDGEPEYEYALGNMLDEFVWNFPITGKATANLTFVGCRTRKPTTTRITGAEDALDPNTEEGVSTSTDLQRLRVTDVDEVGISTDFVSLKVTDKNNITAQKTLARLGARSLNQGKHTNMVDAEVLFTDSEVINAVRDNRSSCMDVMMRNEDFGALLDVQRLTLDTNDRKFERDKIMTISSKMTAFQDVLSTDSLSVFAFLPALPEEEQ